MPAYPYRCSDPACGHTFEVCKPLAQINDTERCEKCKAPAERYISRTHFYGASDWDKAEFNPGLGCVTKNAKHRREIAKRMGLEEAGNTPASDIIKHADQSRNRRIEEGWQRV